MGSSNDAENDSARTISELQERLQLQELISDISGILLSLPADEVDGQIEHALERIVEFLGIDRSSFGEVSHENEDFRVTHSYAAPGIEPYPAMFVGAGLPWYIKKILRGEIVRIETQSDLPEEALQEKTYFEKSGLKSQLGIPISVGGLPLCGIGFGTFRVLHSWPDPLVDQLKRVGEIFAYAIYRKRAEQKLKTQFDFERLISNISARFVNISLERVHEEIESALLQLLQFFRLDRCRLMRIVRDGNAARVTHVHSAEGIVPLPHIVTYSELFPWHVKKILAGETIAINTQDLPLEADVDRRNLEKMGIGSNLVVPLVPAESMNFVLTASTVGTPRTWPEETISRVRLLGEIFTSALVRKSAEEELAKSYHEIKQLKDRLEAEADYLRSEIKGTNRYEDIIGESNAIRQVLKRVEQVARTGSAVLIQGETGTGKELIARAIHNLSPRKNRAMVKVNCATLPSTLIESELFGREKGAYTGALTKQIGRFEVADGSTIFLDEIAELSMDLQAKLLRVLQEGEFEHLGSPRTFKVDVRVIAATNRDLADAVKNRTFRDDLYYRLNVFPIHVPPLRERPKDIPLLFMAFLSEFNHKMGKSLRDVSRQTMESLLRYRWPGNIRELRNVVEQAVIISDGDILRVPLPDIAAAGSSTVVTRDEAESKHITEVLQMTGWRIKGNDGAAKILGLKPSTLYNRMKKLGIDLHKKKDHIRT